MKPVLPHFVIGEAITERSFLSQVFNDDDDQAELNWNNIKHIKREVFRTLFDGLKRNTNLKALSLANTNLTDSTAEYLLDAIRQNKSLKVLNVESNYLSGNMLRV